ncbi:AP-3 complex subunit beta-2 isoform X2 [Neocloeon triangulifer]|uniref:AP-3 complex subunit beta-2 isoform X2 n=1 Tax=Neocloeon triangulifer TaxID=2078957 RepID=UPI00286F1CD1|nr:AP-3 complex subunit beta-2 isoform X2 [Neocloeon triangulifer]
MYAPGVNSSTNLSYNNDRPPSAEAVEMASDPASGGFFNSDYKKHDDLKQMLDSNKDNLKLEAMKRIIGMVAKGREASDLFPAVVKNVVSKNIEVKKLVYVYLVRYAEEQQDLALLSISTFQRALKDPNQLIRASALRVLSSIRVTMIVPIVMLAIKDAAADMSPYVRKTAAHAIPKLYSLDQDQKEELIQVLEKLLSDKTTLVVGSAVMAFEEVCPDRIDLIHKNFRKLCSLLVDVDEWGQVVIINMLTRYARTQFTDPNVNEIDEEEENKRPFYEDEDDGDESQPEKRAPSLDPDHRLLLRSAKPLLQSRNAAVVLSVAQLYHHTAPKSEVNQVSKAMIRLLRSHREVQDIVLTSIAAIATRRKSMFEPFLKSFFVRTSDATHIKLLKLEILTSLASDSNVGIILRELQTYVAAHDPPFVAAAIQAIGRCASNIKEVTDTCLNGLVSLLSNKDQAVVAESVVVIKKLLQTQPSAHREIIIQMAKLVDNVSVPQARASILWLLGEYSERVPKIAPDVLRKMAKSFTNEEDIVKLQVMTLAVKLCLTNPKQTKLLCQYVLQLAKYDQNYDLRDRARFLRHIVFPGDAGAGGATRLSKQAKKIFLAPKPAPVPESQFKDREQFQLGSLSHYINTKTNGYQELPSFPLEAPDPKARDVETAPEIAEEAPLFTKKVSSKNKASFYSDSESPDDESEENSSDEEDDDEEEEEQSNSEKDGEESDTEDEESSEPEEAPKVKKIESSKAKPKKEVVLDESDNDEESEESSSSESGSESDTEDDSSEPEKAPRKAAAKPVKPSTTSTPAKSKKSNLDLLLELDDVMTPSLGGFLTPMTTPSTAVKTQLFPDIQPASAVISPKSTSELLNKINSGGLEIKYRFTRAPHLYSQSMTSVELTFHNHSPEELTNIRIGDRPTSGDISIHEFAAISALLPGSSIMGTLGVDFADSTQPVNFEILIDGEKSCPVALKAPVGELIRAATMSEEHFLKQQNNLRGMHENNAKFSFPKSCQDLRGLSNRILTTANLGPISSSDSTTLRFAAQTLSSRSIVLVSLQSGDNQNVNLTVNCEKMVIGSMLITQLKACLTD